jgi:hypothetical protein
MSTSEKLLLFALEAATAAQVDALLAMLAIASNKGEPLSELVTLQAGCGNGPKAFQG